MLLEIERGFQLHHNLAISRIMTSIVLYMKNINSVMTYIHHKTMNIIIILR